MNNLSISQVPRKRLYRSGERKFLGVLGGFADYLNVDPTILRLAFILFLIFTGFFPGVLIYLLFALFMPKAPL